jgi:hypothetical protein
MIGISEFDFLFHVQALTRDSYWARTLARNSAVSWLMKVSTPLLKNSDFLLSCCLLGGESMRWKEGRRGESTCQGKGKEEKGKQKEMPGRENIQCFSKRYALDVKSVGSSVIRCFRICLN